MSVYKELFSFASEVDSMQTQIYPDAADYGVRVESNSDPIVIQLKSLIEQYDGKVETEMYSTGCAQKITIIGFDEWNTKEEVTFNFEYVHINEAFRKKTDPQGILSIIVNNRFDS